MCILSPNFNLLFNLLISISRSFLNPISPPSLETAFQSRSTVTYATSFLKLRSRIRWLHPSLRIMIKYFDNYYAVEIPKTLNHDEQSPFHSLYYYDCNSPYFMYILEIHFWVTWWVFGSLKGQRVKLYWLNIQGHSQCFWGIGFHIRRCRRKSNDSAN